MPLYAKVTRRSLNFMRSVHYAASIGSLPIWTLVKENNRLDKKISAFDMGYNRAGKDVIVEEEDQPPKPKKRRLNADQRLALGPVN